LPPRVSRQIYISITAEGNKGLLSGRYNFHCLKNGAPAFIREGGKNEGLEDCHPYYMMYKQSWFITKSEHYEKNEDISWLLLESKGLSEYSLAKHLNFVFEETDYLSLETSWEVWYQSEWSPATVKIFTNENDYKDYQESKRSKGWNFQSEKF